MGSSPSSTGARVTTASPAGANADETSPVVASGGDSAADVPSTDPADPASNNPPTATAPDVEPTVPAAAETPTAIAAIISVPDNTPVPVITVVPRPDVTFTMEQAQALLAVDALRTSDFDETLYKWNKTTDLIQSNATLAAADAALGASAARCGRLLGRTLVLQPANVAAAYLGSRPTAAFTQVVVYATAAGAADCGAELLQRYQQRGKLARALGVFDDPESAAMTVADFPPVGSESLAASISGTVTVPSYGPVVVNIFVVMFRTGNVVAVVGVARHPYAVFSGAEMLTPLLNLVLQRIAA